MILVIVLFVSLLFFGLFTYIREKKKICFSFFGCLFSRIVDYGDNDDDADGDGGDDDDDEVA